MVRPQPPLSSHHQDLQDLALTEGGREEEAESARVAAIFESRQHRPHPGLAVQLGLSQQSSGLPWAGDQVGPPGPAGEDVVRVGGGQAVVELTAEAGGGEEAMLEVLLRCVWNGRSRRKSPFEV